MLVPGVKVPIVGVPFGSVHVPPGNAVAPNSGSIAEAAEELHTESNASEPALGCGEIFTVTVATEFAQGGVAVRVYV